MSSIMILDTNLSHFAFEKFSDRLLTDIESMVSVTIDFNPESLEMKKTLPKIDVHSYTYLHSYWVNSFLNYNMKEFGQFVANLKNSLSLYKQRKQMGVNTEPWENYMALDSKIYLPLINHEDPLDVYQQIVILRFILHAISTDTISEYKEKSDKLRERLFEFMKDFKELEDGKNAIDLIQEYVDRYILPTEAQIIDGEVEYTPFPEGATEKGRKLLEYLERSFRMFYLHQRMHGRLREAKNDYFV